MIAEAPITRNAANGLSFQAHEMFLGPFGSRSQVGDYWLPPRDSNPDMLIQRPKGDDEAKGNQGLPSAESGKPCRDRAAGGTNRFFASGQTVLGSVL